MFDFLEEQIVYEDIIVAIPDDGYETLHVDLMNGRIMTIEFVSPLYESDD